MKEQMESLTIIHSMEELNKMFSPETISEIFETILESFPNRMICLKYDFAEEQILVGNMLDLLYEYLGDFQNITSYQDIKDKVLTLFKTKYFDFYTSASLDAVSKIHSRFVEEVSKTLGEEVFSSVSPSDILYKLNEDYGFEIDEGFDIIYDKYHELFEIELNFLKKGKIFDKV